MPDHVACDLCGSQDEDELYAATFDYGHLPAHLSYASSRTRAVHGRIVQCRQCGLVRTNPPDSLGTLTEVYSNLNDPLYDAEYANRFVTAQHKLRFLETAAHPPGQLLDIGCSTGIFMAAAREHGWQVSGIEPSSWAAERARERLGLISIQNTIWERAEIPPKSFDVVTLWDVLEHVSSPTATLQKIHQAIKPGGVLGINIPNVESVVARLMGARWPLLLREHLWFFSPRTLTQLLEKTGFTLISTRPNFVFFSLRNVLTRLSQHQVQPEASLWARLATMSWAEHIRVRFPMGELLALAERR